MELLIAICVFLSYFLGAKAILNEKYFPNIYSRVIWLLFAVNNFASVLLLGNSLPVILLAGLSGLGNVVILLLALKKSKREFGRAELITTILLIISLLIWVLTRLPLLNLTIGIIAHFLGGVPTYRNVIKKPTEEDTLFWFFFFLASSLALYNINWNNLPNYLYPLYFALFDGGMTILCLRRYNLFRIFSKKNF